MLPVIKIIFFRFIFSLFTLYFEEVVIVFNFEYIIIYLL